MDPAVIRLAHDCPLLSRARALAAFVGEGRVLTAKGVLRRAEIAAACATAGLPDPGRVVTAADVPALHRGDCWDHTILLEKVLPAEPGARYPACVGGRGAGGGLARRRTATSATVLAR